VSHEGPHIRVVVSAVEAEARKWSELADRVEPIAASVRSLWLSSTAFASGVAVDAATGVLDGHSYQVCHEQMTDIVTGAGTEFRQIGAALQKIAREYDRVDHQVAVDLNRIWSE
jgi:hypothetical protein